MKINQTTIRFTTIIIMAVIVFWLIWRKGVFEKAPETGPDLPPPDGCRYGFDAKAEAVAVHDTLIEWDILDDLKKEAFSRILGYNDCELTKVHNSYKNKYRTTDYPTLRRLVQAETTIWGWDIFELQRMKKEVLSRLASIGA
jgi:hypothetical protein